jgi:FkbM family methyltransferase
MRYAKKLVRSALLQAGYDFHRLTPASNPYFQIARSLQVNRVDLVFDVGANTGQFATNLRDVGFAGRIVSFEALSAAHAGLVQAARGHSSWTVHPRCAVGDRDGEVEINIAANSVSSSILPMLDRHAEAAPGSACVGRETVPMARFERIAEQYLAGAQRPFLKIDTQGFEWAVLDGAREVLPRLEGVLCEMSFVPLYAGQHLWRDVLERLEREGFALWALQTGFTDPRDGRTLQADGIFFRTT